jgi:hypothetical protein
VTRLHLGGTGAVLLAVLFVLFVLLGAEDALIWARSGSIPGIEFFLGALFVLAVFAFAIREANRHPPTRR